jgi:hypothetical protein
MPKKSQIDAPGAFGSVSKIRGKKGLLLFS